MLELIIELPLSVPILPIGDTSPWNIFAAQMTKDGLDSEFDYVRASPKATGSREEDVESTVKPQNPALNLGLALALLLPRKSNQLPGSGSIIPSKFSYYMQ